MTTALNESAPAADQHTSTMQDQELKARHRAMWALGNYDAVATEVISTLGQILVEACQVGPGSDVLDVAAGTGNAAIPAALKGARVTASDLTPELLAVGQAHASAAGANLDWLEGDAEALPLPDSSYDVVMSCVGVMFAPHHRAAADELVRVCRPGGTIGLLSWTPEGFIGQLFKTMKPYVAPPPPGAQPPPLWGDEEHVRELLGNRVGDLEVRRQRLSVSFATPEAFRDFFATNYGPTVAAYRAVSADPDRKAALDADLAELARRHDHGSGTTELEWEYLLATARRR